MPSAHLIFYVEEALEKVAPVERKHRAEIAAAVPAHFKVIAERSFDGGIVEGVQLRIAFLVSHLKTIWNPFHGLHLLVKRPIGILKAVAKRQLVADVSGEQFIPTRAGENDFIAPLYLCKQIL